MAKLTAGNTWHPASGLSVLEGHAATGWGWNVVVITQRDGGLALYSPSWLGDDTFARIDALGTVKSLIVPSHFHYLAVKRYQAQYPAAKTWCSPGAMARLQGKGGLTGLLPMDSLVPQLPEGTVAAEVEGFKSGEIWLEVPTSAGRALIVCDAFMNYHRPLTGLMGFIVRNLGGIPQGLSSPRTIGLLHMKNREAYRAWARQTIERAKPSLLVPTHGAPLADASLSAQLLKFI